MMKSISAEDMVDRMRYNRNVAIAILILATLILLSTSLYITSATISDADPSTYVIVPILMLPLLLLFSLKTDPEPKVTGRDIVIGTLAFAAFIILSVIMRLHFAFIFVSFRVDMLLFPLAIAALVTLLFGVHNIRKFRAAMLYSLLASPAVLYLIIAQSDIFTRFNTLAVYDVLKPFISSLQYTAPITISTNGYSVGIGQACVSIGIFVALALFLIPVAYLYNGNRKDKVVWVSSGIVLLFVLNLVRMLGISFVWLKYGPNATLLVIHTFIGAILFYVIIVVMILLTKRYGLEMGVQKKGGKAHGREMKSQADIAFYIWPLIITLVFSFFYLCLTLNYSSSLKISPLAFAEKTSFNFSNIQIERVIGNLMSKNNFTSFVVAAPNGTSVAYSLSNKTIGSSNPIVVIFSNTGNVTRSSIAKYDTVLSGMDFFNTNGSSETVLDVVSVKSEIMFYSTAIPEVLVNGSIMLVGAYVIIPVSDLPSESASCSGYDRLYTDFANIANADAYNQLKTSKLISAECLSNKMLWR